MVAFLYNTAILGVAIAYVNGIIAFAKALPWITRHDQPWRTRHFGSGGIGSTRSALIATSRLTWTTRIFNPVKHGLVAHPADWPQSSFHRCVDIGLFPAGWRGGSDEAQQTGERL
jgi:hypothetical protein